MPELTLGQLYAHFFDEALVDDTTKHKCRTALRKLIKYLGPAAEPGDVDARVIAAWQRWMVEKGLANASVRGYFGAASQVFSWAVNHRRLAVNPFLTAQKVRPQKKAVTVLSRDEIVDLAAAAAELDSYDPTANLRWVFMLELAVVSGLRVGEIWNLRWDDIDLDAEAVMIRWRPDKPGQYWQWGTKGKADRQVPIFPAALEAGYRLLDRAPWRYPVLPESVCRHNQAQVGRLTEIQRKNPYPNFYKELGRIKSYANGKRAARSQPPIADGGMHKMRHTAISGWLRSGVSLKECQYLAGHQSELTTLRVYAHTTAETAMASVRDKLTHAGQKS
jgi:integrase